MKKVIALNDEEIRVLTTRETAEKNRWWITHNLDVKILPKEFTTTEASTEPEAGNIMKGNGRFYRINKSDKVLICTVCEKIAKFKIGYRFYCKQHYKHFMLTKPIRRMALPERNSTCECGSGKKYKNCCLAKLDHNPRHYFNSLFMKDEKMVSSLKTQVNL